MNPGRSGVMLENIRELQGGIARALIRAERLHDGIAILHARRAGGLSKFVKDLGSLGSSQVGFQHIIEDLGLQYRYTSTREVENGVLESGEFKILILPYTQILVLESGEFKILILPYTQILSDGEIRAVRAFVENGGMVVADLRPATHDRHGRPLEAGHLDDLFGITQDCAASAPLKGDMVWTQGVTG
jgi:hypothetical protein